MPLQTTIISQSSSETCCMGSQHRPQPHMFKVSGYSATASSRPAQPHRLRMLELRSCRITQHFTSKLLQQATCCGASSSLEVPRIVPATRHPRYILKCSA